jgi:tRNA(Ile)-lysidine synthase
MDCTREFNDCLEIADQTLRNEGWLVRGQPLLVGFSGGPDSLCLLAFLTRLQYPVTAAHFDHQLRGESGLDVDRARALAARLGAAFVSGAADVGALARAHGLSLEDAARQARYRFLFEQARAVGARAVAVGHTADDQVETVLLHLLRGAGLDGLVGMAPGALLPGWDLKIRLARPLLGLWRAETRACCTALGLTPLEDSTNTDLSFLRNRLRLDMIPRLEELNPQFKSRIWTMARSLAEDRAVLSQTVEQAWQACSGGSGWGWRAFSRAAWMEWLPGVQAGLLRKAVQELLGFEQAAWADFAAQPDAPPGERQLSAEVLACGLDFVRNPSRSRQVHLAAGLRLVLEGDTLYVAARRASLPDPGWPQLASAAALDWTLPASLAIGPARAEGGWALRADLFDGVSAGQARLAAAHNADPFQAYLDLDLLQPVLQVRPAQPGVRFHPLGLDGRSQKLSDVFVNARVSARARAAWPLVFSGSDLAWIPGLRISHLFRLTADSQRVAHLRLERTGPGAPPPGE